MKKRQQMKSLWGHSRAIRHFAGIPALILCLACLLLVCGCGDTGEAPDGTKQAGSPDLTYYDNGYGTYFVTGTRIEHPADTSTSLAADWSKSPAARPSADLQLTEERGIVYKRGTVTDGREEGQPLDLHLNLTLPKKVPEAAGDGSKASGRKETAGASPVILLVPGGGFITCRIDNKYTEVQRYLAGHGYAVAIMEYHIIGQGRYMDAAEDVWDAVRWVEEHGAEYGLDPQRIALMGNSAGGYVAALAACRGSSASGAGGSAGEPEKAADAAGPGESDGAKAGALADPRCVVNFYGLCDLLDNKADYEEAAIEAHHRPNSSDSQFVNGALSGKSLTDDLQEAAKADPRTYIDGDEPPFLHLHGDQDLLVSPSQSVHLHDALTAAGVPSTRYAVKGAGHGDRQFRTKACLDLVIGFLDRYCGGKQDEYS